MKQAKHLMYNANFWRCWWGHWTDVWSKTKTTIKCKSINLHKRDIGHGSVTYVMYKMWRSVSLALLSITDCVLGLSFIHHAQHQHWIWYKSLLRLAAMLTLSCGEGMMNKKVASSAQQNRTLSRSYCNKVTAIKYEQQRSQYTALWKTRHDVNSITKATIMSNVFASIN